jgi:hypothetical protein
MLRLRGLSIDHDGHKLWTSDQSLVRDPEMLKHGLQDVPVH